MYSSCVGSLPPWLPCHADRPHIGSMTACDAKGRSMKLKGYDPGLSVKSALKLPHAIVLAADSVMAAPVANANYISMNIPYILKGKGSTQGIIGKEVLNNCKPGAVIRNFAHGEELVDSEASYERHFR